MAASSDLTRDELSLIFRFISRCLELVSSRRSGNAVVKNKASKRNNCIVYVDIATLDLPDSPFSCSLAF